jgi:hypothetical protein
LYPHANIIAPALVHSPTASNPTGGKTLLNAAAFEKTPGPPTAGNVGRNAFTGPGLISADLSISRRIALGDRRKLTLRAERRVSGTKGRPKFRRSVPFAS